MHRFFFRFVPLVALALIVSGCHSDSGDSTVTQPPPTLTETFSGTLTLNGAAAYPFTVTGSGNITAQLTTLMPDATKPVGLSLGTWNGSICQIVLDNPNTVQGSVVVGTASTTGSFCVRIYDASGTVVDPQTYVIDVFHQ
jgi:hypothetical protein